MATKAYTDSPAAREALQRRTLRVVMTSQVFGGAGLAAGVTVGTLLAADMLGTSSLSGLPVALFTAGSAAAALLVGRLSQRLGRRAGLTAGYAAGAIGGAGVVLAAAVDSVPLLMVFLLVYGAGTATNLQARYAGADLVGPQRRAAPSAPFSSPPPSARSPARTSSPPPATSPGRSAFRPWPARSASPRSPTPSPARSCSRCCARTRCGYHAA